MESGLPWVSLGDGGFWEDYGFAPNYSPGQVTSYHSIEHEVAHYLARFANRTFGSWPWTRT
jgi:hypothetical protein